MKLAAMLEPVRDVWVKPGAEARIIRALTFILLAFGLAAVFSASTVESLNTHGNAWYIFTRQLAFAVAGVVVWALVERSRASTARREADEAAHLADTLADARKVETATATAGSFDGSRRAWRSSATS